MPAGSGMAGGRSRIVRGRSRIVRGRSRMAGGRTRIGRSRSRMACGRTRIFVGWSRMGRSRPRIAVVRSRMGRGRSGVVVGWSRMTRRRSGVGRSGSVPDQRDHPDACGEDERGRFHGSLRRMNCAQTMRVSKFGEAPSSANVRATVGELVGQSASSSYLSPARVGGSFRRWAEAGRTDVRADFPNGHAESCATRARAPDA
jgi:hypothetical protein